MSDSNKTNECLIEGRNISKSFGKAGKEIRVLSGANLKVMSGEILGIVGASGVGKSTLLHILGGLDHPTEGEILFRGKNIFSQNNSYLDNFRNTQVGFVFQSFNLMSDFNAIENVMFPALIGNKGKKEARERAESLLEQMGLKDRLDHKPGELSGGETQRVALARGLVNQPALLLADEPTGNLDSRASESLMELFRKLNKEFQQTFVIVTHSQKIAQSLGRVLQLAEGKVNPIDKELII